MSATPAQIPPVERFVGIAMVAEWLDCSESTVRRLCREGLPHHRPRGQLKFLPSEVLTWRDGGRIVVHSITPSAEAAKAGRRRRCAGPVGAMPISSMESELRRLRSLGRF